MRFPVSVAFIFLAGCATPPTPVAEPREQALRSLRNAEESAIQAFGKRDGELAATFYAPDAALMMARMPVVTGPAAKQVIKQLLADPNFTATFQTAKVEVASSGELGYTRGTYSMTSTDPQTKKVVKETGKYLTVYSKQADGSWKIIDDITTPDGPATPVENPKQPG